MPFNLIIESYCAWGVSAHVCVGAHYSYMQKTIPCKIFIIIIEINAQWNRWNWIILKTDEKRTHVFLYIFKNLYLFIFKDSRRHFIKEMVIAMQMEITDYFDYAKMHVVHGKFSSSPQSNVNSVSVWKLITFFLYANVDSYRFSLSRFKMYFWCEFKHIFFFWKEILTFNFKKIV